MLDIHVANPKMLLLIWLVPAVAFWWYRAAARRERDLARFMSPDLQRKLRPADSRRRFLTQLVLLSLGLALAVIAAARPQWGEQEEVVFARGRDVVVVLDVSRSMLATDVRPNRLERAKADILDLTKELRGDRAALVAFRRRAALLCPLTTDYAYFTEAVEAAGPESAPAGETDIGEAIREAMRAFESEEGAHKAIVLISDGEDLAGNARAAAEEAARRGIVIFTVGLGSRDGAGIPDANQQNGVAVFQGDPVRTRLDNEALHAIATLTRGAYIPVETASMTTTTLGTLYRDHLRSISEQDIEERLQRRRVERFQWFLLPALLCLLASTAFSRGRLAPSPARAAATRPASPKHISPPPLPQRALGLACCLIGAAALAHAQSTNPPAPPPPPPASTNAAVLPDLPPGRSSARLAQEAFEAGEFDRAALTYLAAAKGATDASHRDYRYNAAMAHRRAGNFEAAIALLRELTAEDPQAPAFIIAALGATLYEAAGTIDAQDAAALQRKASLTRDAADAFRRAWRDSPGDADARHDTAVSLAAMPERDEAAHIAGLLERYQGSDAGKIATDMLQAQRRINEAIASSATNSAPSRIKELEALAKQQRENADLWIPLKGQLMNAGVSAGTNAPLDAAALNQIIELTRDGMRSTAQQLRDLDPAVGQKAVLAESTIYQLWRATAPYADLLREDIWRQTNAIAPPQHRHLADRLVSPVAEQEEAHALTGLFLERFQQQVPDQGNLGVGPTPSGIGAPAQAPPAQQPPDGVATNIDRPKIIALAKEASATQAAALQALAGTNRAEAAEQQALSYRLLREIESLLPKQSSQQQQQDQQQQQNEQQEQKDQQSQDEQQQPPEPPEADQQPSPPQPEEQPDPEEAGAPASGDEAKPLPEDVERMLERALQRERDHEAEKRRRNVVPLSPSERDW